MEAACELFAEHGYRDTTIRMIVEQAGVNCAAVNYHFRSKEQLYEAVFNRVYQQFAGILTSLPGTVKDGQTWCLAIRRWYEGLLRIFLLETPEHSVFRRLIAQERAAPTEYCKHLYEAIFYRVVCVYRDLMRMALPAADAVHFQAICLTQIGQCTCFLHRESPWDKLELCNAVSREEWVQILCDEILATITQRFSFQTTHCATSESVTDVISALETIWSAAVSPS